MSWASRRRFSYAAGVILFFAIVIGGPITYKILSRPATCSDHIQNHGETSVDRGGPCPLLDQNALAPSSVLWARAFNVRDGSYNAVAYLQNPNDGAGIRIAHYKFGLYDSQNVLVAEKTGETPLLPGGITPVFAGSIETGNRIVAHTYFSFTDAPTWERLQNLASAVKLNDIVISDTDTQPRITATAQNTSVDDITNLRFIATVFDPAGNAFAASQTALDSLRGGERQQIIFSWPDRFNVAVGRIDIVPVSDPQSIR